MVSKGISGISPLTPRVLFPRRSKVRQLVLTFLEKSDVWMRVYLNIRMCSPPFPQFCWPTSRNNQVKFKSPTIEMPKIGSNRSILPFSVIFPPKKKGEGRNSNFSSLWNHIQLAFTSFLTNQFSISQASHSFFGWFLVPHLIQGGAAVFFVFGIGDILVHDGYLSVGPDDRW